MKITNNTAERKEIKAKDLLSHKTITISIEPFGEVDADFLVPLDIRSLEPIPSVTTEAISEVSEVETSVENTEVIIHNETPEEPKVAPDNFICELCGAEFASARSLSTHRTKSHNNN